MTARRFLTIPQFADIFGVSESHVYNMIRDGIVPTVALGRRRMIPAVFVEALEQQALEGFDAAAALAELEAAGRYADLPQPSPHRQAARHAAALKG